MALLPALGCWEKRQGNRAMFKSPSPTGRGGEGGPLARHCLAVRLNARRASPGRTVGEGTASAANSGKMGRKIIFMPIFPAFAAFAVPSSAPSGHLLPEGEGKTSIARLPWEKRSICGFTQSAAPWQSCVFPPAIRLQILVSIPAQHLQSPRHQSSPHPL